MKKQSLARKITVLLVIKLFLLICLWKLFFDKPLSDQDRKTGINQIYFSTPGDDE